MRKRVEGFIEIPDAQIIFKNFAGRERGRYNQEGDRNFCVIIEDETLADQLANDGWNIKTRTSPDGIETIYMPVKIGYKVRPPQIFMVTAEGKETKLSEEELEVLDEVDIASADIAVNPYNWERDEKYGVAAYLKSGWFYLEKTPFFEKHHAQEDDLPPFDI